ncbi:MULTISPECIES: hypothetical protein [Microbacterium]|uniref:Uncharacterized protein n=1 Tax=Microbacterium saccharophilum TaxID=1213358 RepID=A0A7Z7GET2_9MICO|nr:MULTISPECIES: hypothetical protein [Microbacterium]SFI71224.1 hypothetical protein SAMN04487751_2721 [Microbacterium saccharophilum]
MAIPIAPRLVLEPLDERSWRLRDRDVAACEAASVIAYVEQAADESYEATWVAHPGGTDVYTTLAHLLADAEMRVALHAPEAPRTAVAVPEDALLDEVDEFEDALEEEWMRMYGERPLGV